MRPGIRNPNTVLVFVVLAGMGAGAQDFAPPLFDTLEFVLENCGPATTPVDPPSGHAWYRFANHTHTNYSPDGYPTVAERIALSESEGADSVVITDHWTNAACSDPGFAPVGGCVPMCGEEWGSAPGEGGHVGLLNFDPGPPIVDDSLAEMLPNALSRHATVIVNHPCAAPVPWEYGGVPFGIHGIEIWSTNFFIFANGQGAINWWHGYLTGGRIVLGIGGSDLHFSTAYNLYPCNYVLAASNQPGDMQQALEADRVVVTENPDAPLALLWCDTDLDGSFETPVGTNLPITEVKILRFRVEVFDGVGLPIVLFTKGGGILSVDTGMGDPWYADFAVDANAATKDFVRVELQDSEEPSAYPKKAVTNAIYVNFTPGDCDGDGLGNASEETIGTDPYSADSDADGVSDPFETGYDGNPAAYNPYDPATNPTGTDMDANQSDTDRDGIDDASELTFGLDPLDASDGGSLPGPGAIATTMAVVLLAPLVLRRRR